MSTSGPDERPILFHVTLADVISALGEQWDPSEILSTIADEYDLIEDREGRARMMAAAIREFVRTLQKIEDTALAADCEVPQ